MKWQRLLAFAMALLVAVTLGLLHQEDAVGRLTGAERLELWTLDWRQRLARQNRQAGLEGAEESEIVLVLFDEASVDDWEYLSPFPRPVLANLIQSLSGAGARTIGLDVYLDRLYAGLNSREGGDDLLHDAIEQAGNVVLVAQVRETETGHTLALPHPFFADVAAAVGAAEVPTAFETVRYGTLGIRTQEGMDASWALAIYAHARGLDADSILQHAWESGEFSLPGMPPGLGEIPVGWYGEETPESFALTFPTRFIGPPSRPGAENPAAGTFTAYASSVAPVLAAFTPEFFRDKIVLVGTGFHDSDKFRTAYYDVPQPAADGDEGTQGFYGWMFGVEIHANALQNLLDAEYLRPLGTGWTLLLLILAGGATSIFVFWKGAGWGMGSGLLSGVAVMTIAFWGYVGRIYLPFLGTIAEFDTRFIWIPMVAPAITIVLSYVGSTAYVAIVEGREKRFIRGAFGKYVSPAVVEQISDRTEVLRLGGQKRPLSVLFSDLAGFTDLSESMDAEDLITLLNDYLSEMTDLVLQEGGTLDKYIGDAIMAFWNAPQDQEDHADRALRCAVLMQRKMHELNERWSAENENAETLTVRIGVNTGVVVVGNVGGKNRFDYSAIGDAVNLAARLEPANKTYGTLTMASEYTLRKAVASNYQLRELDLMTVKGRTEPVRVYEILELADGQLPKEKQEALGQYNLGLDAYQRRDWELAKEYFTTAAAADPSDEPSKLYISRAQECIENPPAEDWDFVVKRKVK